MRIQYTKSSRFDSDVKRTAISRRAAQLFRDRDSKRETRKMRFKPMKDGVHTSSIKQTRFPGSYDMFVRAEWTTPRGYTLVREATRSVFVSASPSSKSQIKVTRLAVDKKRGVQHVRIDFTPRDGYKDLIGLDVENRMRISGVEGRTGQRSGQRDIPPGNQVSSPM